MFPPAQAAVVFPVATVPTISMRVRGRRQCRECATEWSYFEVGDIACPNCGSLRSRGLDDERSLHTDSTVDLDLSDVRAMAGERPVSEVAAAAADTARAYLAKRGFIDGGELCPLSDHYRRVAELKAVADQLSHRLDPDPEAERYFFTLLEMDRSHPATVPTSLHQAYGLAAASTVEAYLRDLRTWLDHHPDSAGRDCLTRIKDHGRRVDALDGAIQPTEADRMVEAARALGSYLRSDNDTALARAMEALDQLG